MSRYERPYKGATLVRRVEYRIPRDYRTPEIRGGRAVLRLYDGLASQGYKSGYERKPTRWLEAECFTAAGKLYRRQCWRYSGKRWERADLDWRKLCSDLQLEGCTVATPARDLAVFADRRPAEGGAL